MKIPDDIKIMYTIELKSTRAEDLFMIINSSRELWPEVELRSYAMAGAEGEETTAAMVLSNYDLAENEEEEDMEGAYIE